MADENLHAKHRARMQERVERDGLDSLAEHEALEYLLFLSIPRADTNALAHRLIQHFGDFCKVLEAEPDLVIMNNSKSDLEMAELLEAAGVPCLVYGYKTFEQYLDLVKISPNAVPPVCKLMDYGKFRFEQTKREKEARKNQRVVEIKEIRMSPSIDVNDFNVKLRNAQKFLADGNRCKITVRFRGREMAHTNIGQDLLLKFAEECGEIAVMDKSPKLEGRHMSIFLSPKPAKDAKK